MTELAKKDSSLKTDRNFRTSKKGQLHEVWRRFKRNKMAIFGLMIFILLCILALTAPLFFDYQTDVIGVNVQQRLQSPSSLYWFGTDDMGRNIFARVIWGSRLSLFIGLTSATFALIIGGFLGTIAGYFGGKLENIIMRTMDVFQAIPATLLAISIAAALGPSTFNVIIAISISFCPSFARVARAPILIVRQAEYIEAAKSIGAKARTIILNEVIPNSLAPIIVQTTLSVAIMILITSGLSFLGLGVQPPEPEWGSMLAASRSHIRDYSYIALFPGLAIMITILSLNLLGDGLRDALDPRLK
ncbi:MAG: ABC transporter permease [Erysipelothrix sp.]|nr:ABC transporter permease [Erysipelothrix sp.]